jgi:hypothetical protein
MTGLGYGGWGMGLKKWCLKERSERESVWLSGGVMSDEWGINDKSVSDADILFVCVSLSDF